MGGLNPKLLFVTFNGLIYGQNNIHHRELPVMKLLITGVCGFVGSTLASSLLQDTTAGGAAPQIFGLDNFARQGSETNRQALAALGVRVQHGDLRCADDLDQIPACDWVIDAAANPSVLAGVDGRTSSKQVFDHNLTSTIHVLEYCKKHKAGFILLSTSRAYSIHQLAGLPMSERDGCFVLDEQKPLPAGVSAAGVDETFSTAPPISLYGVSKLASELLALEYGQTFNFPVWIDRCGVLAGAGQFGRADQGIFSFWINSYLRRKPLKYIGFGGRGYQARDALHPRDLVPLLNKQFAFSGSAPSRVFNLGGGARNTMSLLQLTRWCEQRFGKHPVAADPRDRPFDIPWMVMDYRRAEQFWNWRPQRGISAILDEIALHAEQHEDWLSISGSL
jgi:CDP-paratose 2-epimerase